MRHFGIWTIGLALLGLALGPPDARAQGPGPIELRDGDRVVLVGGTLIEREAESGYLETQLARRHPGKKIVVRNLGWSGDTVTGESRAIGNPVQDGFKQLVDHVVALKPTVIVLGYGANEAFAGAAGLPKFGQDLARLWDALASTGARFVVLLPPRQANLGPPLPDPALHNADIRLYSAALRAEAEKRGAVVVDLFDLVPERQGADVEGEDLTTNGLHLNPPGYWEASRRIAPSLGGPSGLDPTIALTISDGRATATGAAIADLMVTPASVRFRLTYDRLPEIPTPDGEGPAVFPRQARRFQIAGLPPGIYSLKVDGKNLGEGQATSAQSWQEGCKISIDPEFFQVGQLRERIIAKNLMYFHRWRPQNETYLFGFRKYEQGRNAAELPAFDPLIAAEEAEIAKLSVPKPHVYELIRTGDAAPAATPRTGEAPR